MKKTARFPMRANESGAEAIERFFDWRGFKKNHIVRVAGCCEWDRYSRWDGNFEVTSHNIEETEKGKVIVITYAKVS